MTIDTSKEAVERLQGERYRLAYAITGGEDAPGYLDGLSVDALVAAAYVDAGAVAADRCAACGAREIASLVKEHVIRRTTADAAASLADMLRAERNKVRREVAAWCAHHTMEVPMDRGARKYAGMFDAGEHCGGTHQGMGYSDAILAMIEPEGK